MSSVLAPQPVVLWEDGSWFVFVSAGLKACREHHKRQGGMQGAEAWARVVMWSETTIARKVAEHTSLFEMFLAVPRDELSVP